MAEADDWAAFFEVHRGLPRQGPGEPQDVLWAIERLGLKGPIRVIDAGCGPGADLETLAEALPDARITGMDLHFADEASARVARFGARVDAVASDMARLTGPVDFIWCAGAIYFLGIEDALSGWQSALAEGGKVAFSEPVRKGPPDPATAAFWDEYPALTDRAGIEARINAAGWRLIDTRDIIGAPWEAYYAPMEAKIAKMRGEQPTPAVAKALDDAAREVARWRATPDTIAYLLCLVEPGP